MKSFTLSLLVLVIFLGFFASCNRQEKSIKEGERLHARGDRTEANTEYEKAYKDIKDPRKAGDVAFRIAQNYQNARKPDKAILWYRECITQYNKIKRPAPYGELANIHIVMGNLEEAEKLVAELEQQKPKRWQYKAVEINRLLLRHSVHQNRWERAEKYAEKLKSLSVLTKNKNIATEADMALARIKQEKNEKAPKTPGVEPTQ